MIQIAIRRPVHTDHFSLGRLLLKANFRDFVKSPVVLLGLTICLTLSALSMYSLQLIAFQIISNTKNQYGLSGYEYVIPLKTKSEEEYFSVRERWFDLSERPDYLLVPVIEGTMEFKEKVVPVIGIDPIAAMRYGASSEGSFSTLPSLLVLDEVLGFGDSFTPGELIQGKKVAAAFASDRDYIWADIPVAQSLLQRQGQLDSIWLLSTRDSTTNWWDWVIPGLGTDSPGDISEHLINEFGARSFTWWNPAEEFNRAIAFQLGILALLALAVSTFVIYQITNTAAFRRRQEFQRLLTLGVSGNQYKSVILVVHTVLAFASSTFGILVGHGILVGVLPEGVATFETINVWVTALKTVTVTLVATLVIVWWAHRAKESQTPLWLLSGVGVISVALTIALLTTPSGLIGAELAILAACLANIALVIPLALYVLVKLLAKYSVGKRYGRMSNRYFSQTLSAIRPVVFALSFALANAIGIDLMVSSFKGNFLDMLDVRLTDGVYLTNVKNLDSDDFSDLQGLSELRQYSTGSGETESAVIDFRAGKLDEWQSSRYGYAGTAQPDLLINEIAANKLSLSIGDQVDIRLDDGQETQLDVDHIYRDYGSATPEFFISEDEVSLVNYPTDRVLLRGNTELLHKSVAEIRRNYPEIDIHLNTEIREIAEFVFDQTFILARVMAMIALAVAVFGLACSLTVLLTTRDTEMRLLLTLGISRFKLLRTHLGHSLGLGFVTVVCALPLSILIAWILCEVVHPRAFGWTIDLRPEFWSIAYPSLLCLVSSLVAGFVAMRRTLARVITQPLDDSR